MGLKSKYTFKCVRCITTPITNLIVNETQSPLYLQHKLYCSDRTAPEMRRHSAGERWSITDNNSSTMAFIFTTFTRQIPYNVLHQPLPR